MQETTSLESKHSLELVKDCYCESRETRDEAIFAFDRLDCFPAERGISLLAVTNNQQLPP
jgi:hypothetical protein